MSGAPFEHLVTDVAQLRGADYPDPGPGGFDKEIPALDEHCVDYLGRSPMAMLATSGADGRCDVSPRGGPPGFTKVLDARRIAFADLAGNRRIDSFHNILANPHVGLVFLIPGLKETLRINGRPYLTRDPEVLELTKLPGRDPDLAVGIEVETAFVHCAKAFIRSHLWDPATWPSELPSAARMLRDHKQLEMTVEEVEEHLGVAYTANLW